MKHRQILASFAAVGLVLAGCGSDDGDSAATTTGATETTAGDTMAETTAGDSMAETTAGDSMAETTAGDSMAETTAGDSMAETTAAGGAAEGNCSFGTAEPAAGDLTEVKVAVLPIIDVAPVYYGVECGQFAAQGLNVVIEVVDSGPAASALVASGEVAMGVSAWHPLAATVWNVDGAPDLKVAVDGGVLPPTGNKILVAGDSDIATLADLEGKNVAINARAGSPEVAFRLLMKDNGADPDKVNLVVTPPAEMGAAVQSGAVDAMLALEPFGSIGVSEGLKVLEDELLQGKMQDGSTGGLVASGAWATDNADTLAAFRTAWAGIAESFNSDADGFRAYYTTYTQIPKELADQMAPTVFRTTTEVANVQPAVDASVEAGTAPEGYDVTPYVIP